MPFDAGSIKAKMVLDKSQFEKSARDVNNATKKVAGQAKKTGTAMKGMWKQMAIGMGVTGGITMVVRGLMRQMSDTIKVGRSFEKEWANVTTMLDISRSATEKMKHELRMLSPTLGDTTDLAKGMYQVLSASIEPAKAIKFLGEAAKSAKAGVTDTKTAVDALTTVINAYGMEAEDVTGVSDIMFATVKRGKLTYGELAQSLGTVVPVAATVGIEFKEVAAAVATLTRQGVVASKATMQLRQVMMAVLKPSEEAKEVAGGLGIELGAMALKTKGLSGFLFDLKEKTKGNADLMAKLVPNVRALTAVMALAGEAAEGYAYDQEFMKETMGFTDEAFRKQTESIDFWIETFEVAADKIKIAAYEGLISPLRESIRTAEDFEEKVTAATNRTANDISLHMSGVAEEISWLAKAWKKTDKFLFGWSDSVHKMLDSTNSLEKAQGRLAEAIARSGHEAIVSTEGIKPLSEATKTLAEEALTATEKTTMLTRIAEKFALVRWDTQIEQMKKMAEETSDLAGESILLEGQWESSMLNMEEDTLNFMASIIPGIEFMTTSITDDFEGMGEKIKENFEYVFFSMAQVVSNFFIQLSGLSQTHLNNQMIALNKESTAKIDALKEGYESTVKTLNAEYEAKKKAIEDSLMSEEEKAEALEELEEEKNATILELEEEKNEALEGLDEDYEEKKKAIQEAAFKSQKKISLITAAINIAEAVTKALTGAIPPWNFILAGITAAAGAVQLAAIAGQDFPSAEKGAYLPSPAIIEAGHGPKGEVILPLDKAPGGFGKMSPTYNFNFNVQALDAVDVDRWFRDVGTKQIEELLRRNQGGLTEKAAGYIKQY